MSCSSKKEPPCDSPFEVTSNGCCADGRRCDEVCIAIVAAQECEQASHDTPNCCNSGQEQNTESCCSKQVGSTMLSHGQQGSCCTSDKQDDNANESPEKCTNNRGCNMNTTIVSAEGIPNTCCSSQSGMTSTVGRCDLSGKTGPDADETLAVSEKSGVELQRPCLKTITEECSSMASVASLVDSVDIAEFREACTSHLTAAMKKYKSYLESGICICRNALRRIDNCCDKTTRAAFSRKRKRDADSTSCCRSKNISTPSCKSRKTDCIAKQDNCTSDTAAQLDAKASTVSRRNCCSGQKSGNDTGNKNDAHCQPARDTAEAVTKLPEQTTAGSSVKDLEHGAAREHVTFKIAGMTCTGCVKKVVGVLANVVGAEKAHVNFVAATGSVDIDTAKTTTTTVLDRLEKETGFKCSIILNDNQTLDLLMTTTEAASFTAALPEGVHTINRLAKQVYRVSYNPSLIGARTVMAKSTGLLAPPGDDGTVGHGQRQTLRMLMSFIAAAVFTIPVCILAFANIPVPFLIKGVIELVFATIVQLIAVPEFYIPACKALIFSKTIEMDMLVVISISAAYGYSIVAFGLEAADVTLQQGPLFETSTLLITLVILGRLIASYAKNQALQAVSLKSLQAKTAVLESAEGEAAEVDARLLEFGDVIRVGHHSVIVSDGVIISGDSAVDESLLTGESQPVSKRPGDLVMAGTLNGQGLLRIRLTRLPGKNSITDIADLVQKALDEKPRVQDLADVIAGYFVPVVVCITLVVFVIWVVVALRVREQGAGGAIGTASTYSIAVLAISCPCALGLAVPLVLVIAGGVAARGGVIIKRAAAIERGFKATDVVFDKTGTLTTGRLEVVQQISHQCSVAMEEAVAITYSLVRDDSHPVAQAVASELKSQISSAEAVEEIKSVPGCGVHGVWRGKQVKAGNPYWLDITSSSAVAAIERGGRTLLCVTVDGQLVLSFGLEAAMRQEAQSVIRTLRTRGLKCHIVSGDQPNAVSSVATMLGIDANNAVSRHSPAQKQHYVQALRTAGKTVLFVGDGTNDAVAVAAANVGVQIGAASDVTRATADVVLLGGLEGIITLLEVSKHSFYRIIFNFAWSAIYNVFAILLASGAFVKVRIAPNYAGLGEIVSVLPVVFAALTMLKVKVRNSST